MPETDLLVEFADEGLKESQVGSSCVDVLEFRLGKEALVEMIRDCVDSLLWQTMSGSQGT